MDKIASYLKEIESCMQRDIQPLIYIAGNKVDLRKFNNKTIDKDIVKSFAGQTGT